MKSFDIREDDLTAESTRTLLIEHLESMLAGSPPGHSFALDLSGLSKPNVTVWSAWDGSAIAGVDGEAFADYVRSEFNQFLHRDL